MSQYGHSWTFTIWPQNLKAVDNRINLKRTIKVNKLNPFRKLKRSLVGFKTDSGFDVLFIDKDNKIIGTKMVLK